MMPPQLRWIDTHIHVSDRGRDGAARPHLLEDLLAVLDADAADLRFVITPDANWNAIVRDDPDGSMRAAEFIHALVQRAPDRLFGGCLVNLNFPEQALRTMELCFEHWGFVMLGEFLQYMHNYDLNTDSGEAVIRRAAAYGVPAQVHISTSNSPKQGHTSGMGELLDLLGVAERVPEANYILAHFIGQPDADPPVVKAYLDAIEARCGTWPDNFWAEIRDFNSPGVPLALDRIPANRLIAGTDWTTRIGPPFAPYGVLFDVFAAGADNPYEPSAHALAQFLRQAGADADQVRMIAVDNAAALLGLGP